MWNREGNNVDRAEQRKKHTRITFGKKGEITVHREDGSIKAFLLKADDVVERHVTKSLAGSVLSQKVSVRAKPVRAPHLSDLERDMAELKKVVAALAVRSVVHEEKATDFDVEGVTVLDAEAAYQLLDTPPEPTEALLNLLTLR
ncbi:hypothetical protein C6Y56_18890 [Pseudomonas fluorescens]|uniref:Uncharacterized protein n=1 Tax=Pseudomonas fluorescens TaxID=294 RepID=A0A7Z3H0U5_PSEFL|nr:hypothetical protein C6Y56_18890 [Pseudomonas fluorescens]